MRLSARILENVVDVNSFDRADQAEWTSGDSPMFYFQLIDVSKDKAINGFYPSGRRYMPDAGATLSVTLRNVDSSKAVTRVAGQPFSQDPSIWSIQMLSTDSISGTVQMELTLTEGTTKGTVVTHALILAAVLIHPMSNF